MLIPSRSPAPAMRIALTAGMAAGLVEIVRVREAERHALLHPGLGRGFAGDLPWVLACRT